jgi:hypothetical protein
MLALYDSNFSLCDYLSKKDSNLSWWNGELLERAKRSLRNLSFFGLTEYQDQSQLLFYHMFKRKLKFELKTYQMGLWNLLGRHKKGTGVVLSELKPATVERIKSLNSLDLKLYQYAYELFAERLNSFGILNNT